MTSRRRRIAAAALVAVALVGGGAAWVRLGPLPPGLLDAAHMKSTSVVDRHGTVIYETRDADGTHGRMADPRRLP